MLDYATTQTARELGLGGRAQIPDDYGMLFVFSKDDYYGFWMKILLSESANDFFVNSEIIKLKRFKTDVSQA